MSHQLNANHMMWLEQIQKKETLWIFEGKTDVRAINKTYIRTNIVHVRILNPVEVNIKHKVRKKN